MKTPKFTGRTVHIEIPPGAHIDDEQVRADAMRTSLARQLRGSLPYLGPKSTPPFPAILDSAFVTALIVEPRGRLLDANRRATEVFGYTRHEWGDHSLVELVLGATEQLITDADQALNDGCHVIVNAYGRRKDGTAFPIEMTIHPFETNWCALIRDLTPQRAEEENLWSVYNAALHMRTGLVVFDAQTIIRFANPAATALWSADEHADLAGRNLRALWKPVGALDELLQSAGESWEGALDVLSLEGQPLKMFARATRTTGDAMTPATTLLSLTDITAQHREQQLQLKLEAQNAMIASLGATCHHLGQPAAVALGNLHLLKAHTSNLSPEAMALISDITASVEKIGAQLRHLNEMTEFRTVDYIGDRSNPNAPANRLLDVKEFEN